ncbi:MAG: Thivi_2564 family membrane protein [Edaphobacter sp.]
MLLRRYKNNGKAEIRGFGQIFEFSGTLAVTVGIFLASQIEKVFRKRTMPMFTPALISIIVTLIVIGLLLYLIGLIPMDGTIKQIIRVVIIIAVIIWLLQSFGLLGSIGHGHLMH